MALTTSCCRGDPGSSLQDATFGRAGDQILFTPVSCLSRGLRWSFDPDELAPLAFYRPQLEQWGFLMGARSSAGAFSKQAAHTSRAVTQIEALLSPMGFAAADTGVRCVVSLPAIDGVELKQTHLRQLLVQLRAQVRPRRHLHLQQPFFSSCMLTPLGPAGHRLRGRRGWGLLAAGGSAGDPGQPGLPPRRPVRGAIVAPPLRRDCPAAGRLPLPVPVRSRPAGDLPAGQPPSQSCGWCLTAAAVRRGLWAMCNNTIKIQR